MRAAGALLLLLGTAHAHDRGEVSLKVALGANRVVGVVLELSAQDVAQLAGRSDAEAARASAFEQVLVDHAARSIGQWIRVAGDGARCDVVPDIASPAGPHRIRVVAAARCEKDSAEIALRWRAAANGLGLTATGTLVSLDGTHTPLSFALDADWQLVKAREGLPTWLWPVIIWALALIGVVVWRRLAR